MDKMCPTTAKLEYIVLLSARGVVICIITLIMCLSMTIMILIRICFSCLCVCVFEDASACGRRVCMRSARRDGARTKATDTRPRPDTRRRHRHSSAAPDSFHAGSDQAHREVPEHAHGEREVGGELRPGAGVPHRLAAQAGRVAKARRCEKRFPAAGRRRLPRAPKSRRSASSSTMRPRGSAHRAHTFVALR